MPADRISSYSPWHLVLVLDDSGSMQGRKIEMLNEAMRRMVDEMQTLSQGLKPYFRISIICFGDEAEIVSEAESEMDIDVTRVSSMAGRSGTTNATAALDLAYQVLQRNPGESHHFDPFLFFFSDGNPDDRSSALLAGERLKSLSLPCGNLRLITIGIGSSNNEFMRQLATQREGVARYRRLESDRDVLDFFPDIGTVAVSQTTDTRAAADKLEEDYMVL